MPSKLLGMLASGKAVIATANLGTELKSIVSQVGIVVATGRTWSALCMAILTLTSSPELRISLGEKGRDYVCKNWSENIILTRFKSQLQKLIKSLRRLLY